MTKKLLFLSQPLICTACNSVIEDLTVDTRLCLFDNNVEIACPNCGDTTDDQRARLVRGLNASWRFLGLPVIFLQMCLPEDEVDRICEALSEAGIDTEAIKRMIHQNGTELMYYSNALALSFLHTLLNRGQRKQLHTKGGFTFKGSDGYRYRLSYSHHSNIERLDASGKTLRAWCCHSGEGLPVGDNLTSQFLALRSNASAFLANANVQPEAWMGGVGPYRDWKEHIASTWKVYQHSTHRAPMRSAKGDSREAFTTWLAADEHLSMPDRAFFRGSYLPPGSELSQEATDEMLDEEEAADLVEEALALNEIGKEVATAVNSV